MKKSIALYDVSYDDLFRNNENFIGKILYYEGEIIQSSRKYDGVYDLRVRITGEDMYSSDIVWVNYAGPRILEDDIVGFYGIVKDIKSYTAVLGQAIEIPEIDSLHLSVIDPSLSDESMENEIVVSIGETVVLDETAYMVQAVEKSDRSVQGRPNATGMLIAVFLQIENKELMTTDDLDMDMFTLTDSKDRVFTVVDESAKDNWRGISWVDLQPNIPNPAYVVFEVPFDPELSYRLAIRPYDAYKWYDGDDLRFINLGSGSSFDRVER